MPRARFSQSNETRFQLIGKLCLKHIVAPTIVLLLGGYLLHQLLSSQLETLRNEIYQRITVIEKNQQANQKGTGNIATQIQGSNNVTTQSTSVQEANRPVFSDNSNEGKIILERIQAGASLLAEAQKCKGKSKEQTQQLGAQIQKWGNDTYSTLNSFSKAAGQHFLIKKSSGLVFLGCTHYASELAMNLEVYVDNLRLMIK